MLTISQINKLILFVSVIGIQLSFYAYVVETRKERDEDYVAVCDISEHMSCSRAFMSPYGRGLGIVARILGDDSILNQPNSISGIVLYSVTAILSTSSSLTVTKWLIGLCMISNVGSIYLAYVLYFILYDFCIVCVSTYLVNAINLSLAVWKHQDLRRLQEQSESVQEFEEGEEEGEESGSDIQDREVDDKKLN